MNRFVFGKGWVYQAEEDDETGGAGGGGAGGGWGDTDPAAGGGAGGDDDDADAAAAAAAAAGEPGGKKEGAPADMKSAIDAALGYKKPGEGDDPADDKKAGGKPAAGGEGKETETHHANGAPKKNEKGEALDDKGQVVQAAAPKIKTAAELDLKPEERKALGTRAQIRFGELINTVKHHEAQHTKDAETIQRLQAGHDDFLGLLKETNTSQDALAGYLHFNALVQSKDPKHLEEALGMLERQRVELYKALGREPKGGDVDLLADYPDLKKQVDEEEITREAALEIASARREKAARKASEDRQQQQQRSSQQTAEQRKAASEKALKDIEAWTGALAKTDLDYKAKEDKLLAKLDGVLKNYPPEQWVATLKLLYEGIEIQKAPATSGKQQQPLRPSGAKPGAKAPNSMLEAINAGLGYGQQDG